MKNFNYQDELQKIIDNKQLAEVRFHSNPGGFKVAYILNTNAKYLTLAEIEPKATLDGVCVYLMTDVYSIKVGTTYVNTWSKKITDESQYEQALKDIEGITDFSFEGFISRFENTDTLVEILLENTETLAGKIVAHD